MSPRPRMQPLEKARSFGLSVGTVLATLALVFAWRGRTGRAEVVGAIGVLLVVFGYLRPAVLRIPSDAWWAFAGVLGWINARVLLSLAFLLVLTPIGILWRMIGRDPMNRRRSQYPGWTAHASRYRDRKHFERMY
jgi:hypothetical protein